MRARDGTVFLDEVGDMPVDVQVKLLRVLETRRVRPVGADAEVDVTPRFVAATNVDLEGKLAAGSFRADFHSRLAGLTLQVPSLSERRSDVPLLAKTFAARNNISLTPDALAWLSARSWPYNVRGLLHFVEVAAALADGPIVDAAALSSQATAGEGGPSAA